MKILHIVGARPQFIKLFPLLKELNNTKIISKVLHTGQHFDDNMSDVFFRGMGIKNPDYQINLKTSSVSKILDSISKILSEEDFDALLVFGDTNSTLAGALAGRKKGLNVIHCESGVRNLDPKMPEEINRIIVDRISDILLCVSDNCVENLKSETCWYNSEIHKTGDLMLDTFNHFKNVLRRESNSDGDCDRFLYVTIHRAHNTDSRKNLSNIIRALNEINNEIDVICPIHPRTAKMLKKFSIKVEFKLLKPLGYLENLNYILKSEAIITDSGGVVREAYWAKKSSIILAENPYWPELIELNACISSASDFNSILINYKKLKKLNPIFNSNVYGDGNASSLIKELLLNFR